MACAAVWCCALPGAVASVSVATWCHALARAVLCCAPDCAAMWCRVLACAATMLPLVAMLQLVLPLFAMPWLVLPGALLCVGSCCQVVPCFGLCCGVVPTCDLCCLMLSVWLVVPCSVPSVLSLWLVLLLLTSDLVVLLQWIGLVVCILLLGVPPGPRDGCDVVFPFAIAGQL